MEPDQLPAELPYGVVAKCDFSGGDGQLTLRTGDQVNVSHDSGSGWLYETALDGTTGWMPKSYAESAGPPRASDTIETPEFTPPFVSTRSLFCGYPSLSTVRVALQNPILVEGVCRLSLLHFGLAH